MRFILLCTFFTNSIFAQTENLFINIPITSGFSKLSTIDAGDSVFFDLSQINLSSSPIEIPVSILSDDTIYALDFSLKYDHAVLEYDTILNLTSYLMPLSYYNTNDSTIRFTSSSFQSCTLSSPLVLVRFNLLTPSFSNPNLYSLKAYLNGNQCSVKINYPAIQSLSEVLASELKLYPNPASESTIIESTEPFECDVYNQIGENENMQFDYLQKNSMKLNLKSLKSGMYFLHVKNSKGILVKKLLVCH